ncbi:hypothetical protein NQ038_11405 [Brevibacterium sp. 50QC2O2]|jgi:Flp pilus assembly protein TadG|uniref:hypothetical protein n=1 Tax=Brevibacterium TaxID=1696 RepID=UPI00211D0549|nr:MULTISPECIES: hypothetical protein [unclassified Brevibacterium]MCQ9367388.1 hypothetical protein [Brevibacterium sp. 91QC2O2]MCQ9384599.1 hypothetical protein [Brevibacterium sp. 68QC2CO]MCQ9389246.1 hypothetical protein [Brevibacterium sp. 50QC2O2]
MRDRGSAPVEFIFGSVVLLIPLIYLLVAFAQIQAASMAAQATAVDAARAAARTPEVASATAHELARMHFADFGVTHAGLDLSTDCETDCRAAGTLVTARVALRVPLPGVALIFGREGPGTVTVRASHTDQIARSGADSPSGFR